MWGRWDLWGNVEVIGTCRSLVGGKWNLWEVHTTCMMSMDLLRVCGMYGRYVGGSWDLQGYLNFAIQEGRLRDRWNL